LPGRAVPENGGRIGADISDSCRWRRRGVDGSQAGASAPGVARRARRHITFGGHDRYQARNVHRDVHDAVMVARVRLEMSEDGFEVVIGRVRQNYLCWFARLDAAIEHKPAGQAFDAPLEIRDEYRPLELTDTPLLSKIIVYRKEQVILLVGNHVYEFTMGNISYPVYAMAFIFEDHVHTSFMVNTPAFDVDAFTASDGAVPMDLALSRTVAR
jgi:hypothetical protein